MVARLLVVGLIVLSATGCSSGKSGQGTSDAPATQPTTTAADEEPAVEPMSAGENGWVVAVKRIRPRIEKVLLTSSDLTRDRMRQLAKLMEGCKTRLEAAGPATDRFRSADTLLTRGCSQYAAAAKSYRRMIAVSSPEGGVLVGSPEVKIFNRALDHALAAQTNAGSLLSRGEEEADKIRIQIEADSAG